MCTVINKYVLCLLCSGCVTRRRYDPVVGWEHFQGFPVKCPVGGSAHARSSLQLDGKRAHYYRGGTERETRRSRCSYYSNKTFQTGSKETRDAVKNRPD